MSYIGNSPGVASQRVETTFTATAAQTVFTPSSGYTLGYCDVYQNGVKLVNGDDYTAADGATVTLTTGAASGDSIVIVASFPRGLSDGYLKTESDGRFVKVDGSNNMTGGLNVTIGGSSVLGGATNPVVAMAKGATGYVQSYLINTTNGTSSSADIVAYPNNGTDASGWVDMGITSSSYADTTYTVTGPNEAYLFGSAPSGAGKTGNLVIATDSTGTANSIQFYTNGFTQAKSAARMTIDGSGRNLIGLTSWSDTDKLVVGPDTAGTVSRIAMSAASGQNSVLGFFESTTRKAYINWNASGIGLGINAEAASSYVWFGTAGTERARIDSSGRLLIGANTPTQTANLLEVRKDQATTTTLHVVNNSSNASYVDANLTLSGYNTGLLFGSIGANVTTYGIPNLAGIAPAGVGYMMMYSAYPMVMCHYSAQPLVFGTSNTERARIDSNGVFKQANDKYVANTYSEDAGTSYTITVPNGYGTWELSMYAFRNSSGAYGTRHAVFHVSGLAGYPYTAWAPATNTVSNIERTLTSSGPTITLSPGVNGAIAVTISGTGTLGSSWTLRRLTAGPSF